MNVTKDGITIAYTGSGNETISVYAGVNEGIDKKAAFRVDTVDKSKSVNIEVFQSGKREIFTDFVLVDGRTFNVLKNGIQ